MSMRQQRLADEIRDTIAGCFLGGRMEDPRLATVSITAVKLTADLQLASVYFRTGTESSQDQAKIGLEHAAGFLRRQVAGSIPLRRVPNLRFFYDESVERASRIEQLLESH